jgi:hypothetical protein
VEDVGDVGVAGIGDDMVGIAVVVGIGGKGDTEREFGSGIRVGSAVVVVEVPTEVRELHDERLDIEPRDIEVDIGGDDILSLTFITFVFSCLFFSFSFLSLSFSHSFRVSFSRPCINTL